MPPAISRTEAVSDSTRLQPVNMQAAENDQNVESITNFLRHCNNTASTYLESLLGQGHIKPLNMETHAMHLDMYGGGEWDIPVLAVNSPWSRMLPSAEEVKDMIATDMSTTGSFRLWPTTTTIGESQVEAERLLAGITEPNFQGQGHSIRSLIAPSLDSMPTTNPLAGWEDDGVLRQSTFRATVMPSKGTIDVAHHEQWTVSTLMTGTRVLVLFAPTKKNLGRLRAHYDELAEEINANTWNLINDMEGGIAFVQKAGETVYIAPLCAFAIFSITTSTSAERYITEAANKYLVRLQNLPLFLAWNKLHQDQFQQPKLIEHMKLLADDFSRIMGKTVPGCDTSATITQICRAWDSVKNDIIDTCAEIWDEKQKSNMFETFETAWLRTMTGEDYEGDICPICGVEMEAGNTKTQAGKALIHFTFVHWKAEAPPAPRTTRSMGGQ